MICPARASEHPGATRSFGRFQADAEQTRNGAHITSIWTPPAVSDQAAGSAPNGGSARVLVDLPCPQRAGEIAAWTF
jgi:hypothetical protein